MKKNLITLGIIAGFIVGILVLVSLVLDEEADKAIEQVLWEDKIGFKGAILAHKIGKETYIVGEWVVGRPVEPLWLVKVGKAYNINGLAAGRTPHLPFADLNPVWAHEQWIKTRGRW